MMTVLDIKKIYNNVSNFPVVAIGVANGELDVLKKIFSEISQDSGMTYIIVQHFTSNIPNLSEILSQSTAIPVHEIINDINLEPNHIYIMPENIILTTQDGVLKLKRNTRNESTNNNIDVFFESLAEVYKSALIGIMLFSDSDFDGAMGFKKIKEVGGVSIIENSKNASFKGIPQKNTDSYTADYVIEFQNIPSELLQIQKKYMTNYAYNEQENIPKKEEEIFNQIIDLISLKTANDFKNYKQSTLRRRIAIRMVIVQKDALESYYNFLRNSKTEQDILFNEFLITVTYFFRDPKYFESLTEIVFPSLIKNTTTNALRIWVAGCSTGEEAYSLAISIHEYLLETNNNHIKVQIFATDLSEKSIIKARNAVYSNVDVQHISDERLQNYFVKSNGQYHIKKVIRDMCIFAVHNIVKDAPFATIDLISCRNVLSYFNSFLQSKALTSFHYSLKDRGILFIGKSETVINASDLFENITEEEKIYTRKSVSNRYVSEVIKPVQNNLQEKIKATELKENQKNDFQKIVSDILFSKYTPVSVIINENLEIVHFHGDTSPFLSPPSGKPSFNILKMADENIKLELQNAILKVKSEKINIRKDNVPVKKQSYLASFEVVPLQNDNEHLMILFYKIPLEDESKIKQIQKNQDQKRIDELEIDLSRIHENIKQTEVEQKNDNEELQTINELLKNTTQELESTQEELRCLNYELEETQKQLTETIDFSESIIQTIHEPLLIIDKYFIVKSANEAFYNFFKTTEFESEGHRFFEIGKSKWNILELKEEINKVIQSKETIKNFKVDMIGEGIGKKIVLLNGSLIQNSTEDLILLTFNDITELVNANELLMLKKIETQKYNKQLETFTAAASHDLNEPLRKIHMFSKRTFENEKNISELGKHDLERIQCLILNTSKLIEDVINYSRVNFLEKEYKKTDLNSVLKKSIKDLKDIITDKNAVISVVDLPVLHIIPNQIQQLFTNLIINSIKYSKQGVIPEIKFETQPTSKEEIIVLGGNPEIDYVKICITDNGIGFDKTYETKIFEPFYRVHNKEHCKGSGLGLTLAKKIMANHRGFIKSISEKNKGTTIVIYIPS